MLKKKAKIDQKPKPIAHAKCTKIGKNPSKPKAIAHAKC